MSKPIFTWFPEFESSLDQSPNVNVTKFGDGYEQRAAAGINNNPQKWTLQFSVSSTATQDALAFIRARNALESFTWTNPLNETGTYVCRSWKMNRKQGVNVLQMTFEQVFEV
jgi:phage-related protein